MSDQQGNPQTDLSGSAAPDGASGPDDVAAPDVAYQAATRTSPAGYLVVFGFVLLASGFAWYRVEEQDRDNTSLATTIWIFISLLLILGPLAWHSVDWWNDLTRKGAGRRMGAFLNVTLTIVLSVVVFGVISGLNMKFREKLPQIDMTATGRFSLGDETKRQLDRLEGTLYLTYVEYDRPTTDMQLRTQAEEQLKVYARHSSKIIVKIINSDEATKTREYLGTVGVDGLTSGERQDVIVVTYAEPSREVVRGKQKEIRVEPFTFAKQSATDGEVRWRGERVITSGIQELVFQRFKVYATGGHGELSLTDEARDLRERLTGQNLDVVAQSLDLSRTARVPEDCNLLLIVGPKAAFAPDEQRAIIDYSAKGGAVLACLDIDPQGRRETGLEEFLGRFGIAPRINYRVMAPFVNKLELGNSAILQMEPTFGIPRESYSPDHPSVRALREGNGFTTVFIEAGYLELDTESLAGRTVDPVIWVPELPAQYQQQARPFAARITPGRTDYNNPKPDTDRVGVKLPVVACASLAVTSGGTSTESRISVVADADIFLDPVVRKFPANLDLFTGLAQWTLKREDLNAVSEKTMERLDVVIDGRQVRMATWWPLMTTLMALFIGAAVWWSRRR